MPEAIEDDEFADWIGRTMEVEETLIPRPALLLASILPPTFEDVVSRPLPPLWHWLYFQEIARIEQTAVDGHPNRGDFLPPVAAPRRMWAGGALTLRGNLAFGDVVRRRSRIANVIKKIGRSGRLYFVSVEHLYSIEGETRIEERQDIVYRDAPKGGGEKARRERAVALSAPWREEITPSPVMLFRYSAATFNSHRIHYDRTYATQEEGYSGLVVHGPLLATLLADLAERRTGQRIRAFEFRALRPIFDLAPFTICATRTGSSIELEARTAEGAIGMAATATLAS